MLKICVFLIILLSQYIPVKVLACDKEEVHLGAHQGTNVIGGEFCVPYEKIKNTPPWDGNIEKLPILFAKAIKVAQESLNSRWKDSDDFILTGVSIQRVGRSDLDDRWYFTINTRPKGYRVDIVSKVLFDGEVVAPNPYP